MPQILRREHKKEEVFALCTAAGMRPKFCCLPWQATSGSDSATCHFSTCHWPSKDAPLSVMLGLLW